MYGIARIDASGRICERAVITALGWAGGDLLTFTADAGVVTARRDPGGMVTLPASTYITIPAALRRRCGLEPGDQVLLAALPDQNTLAAYCPAVLDQAIRAHGALPDADGGSTGCHAEQQAVLDPLNAAPDGIAFTGPLGRSGQSARRQG